jgi:hypothetical protein
LVFSQDFGLPSAYREPEKLNNQQGKPPLLPRPMALDVREARRP